MLRLDTMDGSRSADVARRCSGSGGTSRSLSLISLCMRLKVRGRGSPGTTFLLPLLCSKPPLDCGLSISFLAALSGLLFTGDGGSSSSRFSQVPSLLKLKRFHMLLFPTSVRARWRLLSRLAPPFAASNTGGIFLSVVSHAPHERGAVSLLSLRRQPSYSLDQTARLARRIAGLAKGIKARSVCRGAGTAPTRAAYVRLDWTCGVGLAPPSCCVVVGVTVAATSIHGRASPFSSASRSLRVPQLSRNCACVLISRACSR